MLSGYWSSIWLDFIWWTLYRDFWNVINEQFKQSLVCKCPKINRFNEPWNVYRYRLYWLIGFKVRNWLPRIFFSVWGDWLVDWIGVRDAWEFTHWDVLSHIVCLMKIVLPLPSKSVSFAAKSLTCPMIHRSRWSLRIIGIFTFIDSCIFPWRTKSRRRLVYGFWCFDGEEWFGLVSGGMQVNLRFCSLTSRSILKNAKGYRKQNREVIIPHIRDCLPFLMRMFL